MMHEWLVVLSVVVAPGSSQEVRLEQPLTARLRTSFGDFDSNRQVLVSYRNSESRDDPSVVAIDLAGRVLLQATPLKDFPKATKVDVWDAAATSSGVVVAAVIQDGRPPRHALLLYGGNGTLEELWQVYPNHIRNLAVDRSDNVYALVDRMEVRPAEHLMVKYSQDGKVAREFLPANLFPKGQRSVIPSGRSGDNQLWIVGDRLMLYMASVEELLEFDLEGNLQRRVPLADQLLSLVKEAGGSRAQIRHISSVDEPDAIVAQVGIWVEGRGFSFGLVRLSLVGGAPQRLRLSQDDDLGGPFAPLLGSSRGRLLFLNTSEGVLAWR